MSNSIILHRVSVAALACAIAAPSIAFAQDAQMAPAETSAASADDPADQVSTPQEAITAPPVVTVQAVVAPEQADAVPERAPKARSVGSAQARFPAVPDLRQRSGIEPVASSATSTVAPPEVPTVSPPQVEQAAATETIPSATFSEASSTSDQVAFGGALALLIVGAGALGMTRRRRKVVEEAYAAPEATPSRSVRREIDISPAPVVPTIERSAFAWGNPVRQAAISPIEKAEQGPSPDNPSLSLKKRLKRAHFFAQRERDAAQGNAVPVSRYAGLPSRMVERAKVSVASRQPSFQLA